MRQYCERIIEMLKEDASAHLHTLCEFVAMGGISPFPSDLADLIKAFEQAGAETGRTEEVRPTIELLEKEKAEAERKKRLSAFYGRFLR